MKERLYRPVVTPTILNGPTTTLRKYNGLGRMKKLRWMNGVTEKIRNEYIRWSVTVSHLNRKIQVSYGSFSIYNEELKII